MAGKKKSEANVNPNSGGWGGARQNSGPKLAAWKTRTTLEKLMARLAEHNQHGVAIDPLTWWWSILNDPGMPDARRDKAAEMLATYTIARPKPVDEEGSSDNKVTIIIEQQPMTTINHQPLRSLPQSVVEVSDDD